jgi:acylphosphatase
MSDSISILVNIEGRVQGVWFRSWSLKEATFLGLSGWVRNKPDGSVEAVFSGPENVVRKMLERCWDGPIQAQVRSVVDEPCAPPNSGFHQLLTN